MKLALESHTARWFLAAGLVLGAASAHAAGGFVISREEELQVVAGMTADKVRQVAGSPAGIVRYGNELGSTWSYNVAGVSPIGADSIVFDVVFGDDGRVASVGEVKNADFGD